jgi:hypothetical protein
MMASFQSLDECNFGLQIARERDGVCFVLVSVGQAGALLPGRFVTAGIYKCLKLRDGTTTLFHSPLPISLHACIKGTW